MMTTLNKIRAHSPCADGWTKLLRHLGKTQADDEPLSITVILDSNGLDDALWCLQAVEGYDREIRLYAVWCARQVQHLMTDPRSLAALAALDVAERYANGEATDEELVAARVAAEEAVAAAWDAWDAGAAGDAACAAAAQAAALDAAWTAAWAAACAAACATRDEARVAAWAAAEAAQAARLREVCAECEALLGGA